MIMSGEKSVRKEMISIRKECFRSVITMRKANLVCKEVVDVKSLSTPEGGKCEFFVCIGKSDHGVTSSQDKSR